VNANLLGGDENGLGQEDNDPAGKCDTVNDPEGGGWSFAKKALRKKVRAKPANTNAAVRMVMKR